MISIHAPRGGSDQCQWYMALEIDNFNPRSPWGERHSIKKTQNPARTISIHAPRGGSDDSVPFVKASRIHFNPRSPWGERQPRFYRCVGQSLFQSTLPVGGATMTYSFATAAFGISIHAPRGGSDRLRWGLYTFLSHFNPRSPWGERRNRAWIITDAEYISIHAPRGGSDWTGRAMCPASWISIHAPRGGSDGAARRNQLSMTISIHAPRGGSDHSTAAHLRCLPYFNPRSPWGGATNVLNPLRLITNISIHAPRGGGATVMDNVSIAFQAISIHAPRGGERPEPGHCERYPLCDFNPRSPWGGAT